MINRIFFKRETGNQQNNCDLKWGKKRNDFHTRIFVRIYYCGIGNGIWTTCTIYIKKRIIKLNKKKNKQIRNKQKFHTHLLCNFFRGQICETKTANVISNTHTCKEEEKKGNFWRNNELIY